jgi:hypothetical protein
MSGEAAAVEALFLFGHDLSLPQALWLFKIWFIYSRKKWA